MWSHVVAVLHAVQKCEACAELQCVFRFNIQLGGEFELVQFGLGRSKKNKSGFSPITSSEGADCYMAKQTGTDTLQTWKYMADGDLDKQLGKNSYTLSHTTLYIGEV